MAGFDNETIYGTGLDLSGSVTVSNRLNVDGAIYIGSSTTNPQATVPTSSDDTLSVDVGPGTIDFTLGSGLTGTFLVKANNLSDVPNDAAARTNLGLGTIATQNSNSVSITGGSITGITDLAVADGGTGASNASDARTNLGLVIGTNVQAWDQGLQDISALAVTDGNIIVGDGANWVAESGATARTSLGLGTIATQDSNNVTITGGSITGITDLVVADGGTGVSSLTAYAVLTGGTSSTNPIQSIASVGTAGQVFMSNGSSALPTFQNPNFKAPFFSNLGMNYNAGTFTIRSASGSDLSSTNPAIIILPSRATPGNFTTYTVTANQNFVDDAGSSEIVGNLFGFTTSVAITVDVPFYIYAVSNDSENDIQFMLSRYPHKTISAATIGDPGSAVADAEGNFWAFNDITVGDYDQNPCVCVGSIRMRMSASDDWTVQALSNTGDGIGNYNEDTSFTQPLGQFGANSGTMTIPNGGTAAVFTTTTTSYYVSKDGYCHYKFVLDGDGGTDGATAVSALFTMPFTNPTMASYGVGKGRWAGASTSQPLSLELITATPNAFQTINISPGTTQWNAFTSGNRNISGTIYMKLA